MARRVPLRSSLLARLLGTSVLIALLSTSSTAWLVFRSTTLAIEQERGDVLADDVGIQDALTGYAARHGDWKGVSRTVRRLAAAPACPPALHPVVRVRSPGVRAPRSG
ncbi:hypothetical protein [Streptomyces acidicola]|uniref:hypothetical protein n=1 Tax=Streptomyces acidicola TaxID=2596892 RepID=UPI003F4D9E64